MRILMVSPWLGDLYGQERMVAESARLLTARGHQVFGMASILEGAPISYLEQTALVEKLHACSFMTKGSEVDRILREVRTFLDRVKLDVIHLIDLVDSRISALMAEYAPLILSVHSVGPTCPASTRLIRDEAVCIKKSSYQCLRHDLAYGCLRPYGAFPFRLFAVMEHLRRRDSLDHYQAVVAVSEYIRNLLVQEGVPASKTHLIYNPVSVGDLSATKSEGESARLICVSRLVPLKGISRLIEACAKLKSRDWTLTICGDGPERERLEAQIADLGLGRRVKLTGHVSHAEVVKFIASSQLLIQANVGPEAFGLSVAEASARGVPVVAFDVPAVNEIIKNDENGILVPPNDSASLARAIDLLLEDKVRHARLSKNGPGRMSRLFGAEAYLDKTLELYQSLVGKREWLMQIRL